MEVSITGGSDFDTPLAALTSASGGLDNDDFEEVIRYAEFRKARQALEKAKRPKSKRYPE
ncbi:hypothetical protein [Bradyrhizobium paxllaeri]|uniref:hypothetical protein n=1 Tax=Bradyrhizobium paxllaeri TaxID=190148 RepID=UPI000810C23C|nr:hypothetical protein [Bradyrhizobium paxllaeri]